MDTEIPSVDRIIAEICNSGKTWRGIAEITGEFLITDLVYEEY